MERKSGAQLRVSRTSSGRVGSTEESLLQWVNFVLGRTKMRATNLTSDMADGVLLAQLVSTLSKKSVGRIKQGTELSHFERLSNVTVVFGFLRSSGVRLANIGPEDVVRGNVKLVQGLIWTLINFYLVELEEADEDDRVPARAASSAKLTPKQRLLEWVQFIVNSYPGVKVESWTKGFEDGLALCALVHFHHPRSLDYYALKRDDAVRNVDLVLDVLKRGWGIPAFVDPRQLVEGHADESMLLTLVATCKKELKNPPSGEKDDDSDDATNEQQQQVQQQQSPSQQQQQQQQQQVVAPEQNFLKLASREHLRRVVEHARQGQRKETDAALADVLRVFRDLLQRMEDKREASSAERQANLKACRKRIDRGLRNLMDDAVGLCERPQSRLQRRLVRRDVGVLCAGELEAAQLLADDTDSSCRAIMDGMRSLRHKKERHEILEASKQLEEDNVRLADAAKSRVASRASQLDSSSVRVANLMVSTLATKAPLFGPLAERLAQNPDDRTTQRELAELNRDISNTMAALDLTLQVDASQELRALADAIAAAETAARGAERDRALLALSHRCQAALTSARKACAELPKSAARPVLEGADELDEAYDRVTQAPGDAEALRGLKTVASQLEALVCGVEAEQRRDSAVPQVQDAVAGVLTAVGGGDVAAIKASSAQLAAAVERAVSMAQERSSTAKDPECLHAFARDLRELQPMHEEAARVALANPNDRTALRRVAETARDVLGVVRDLEEVSRPPPADDEFASLQALLLNGGGESFDVVTDVRDVADAAREAVSLNPFHMDAADLLVTIEELERAVPSSGGDDDGEESSSSSGSEETWTASQRAAVERALPQLEGAVRRQQREQTEQRHADPHDDLVRLARYARAGVKNDRIKELQHDASEKVTRHTAKRRSKARRVADPIRQQRIMETLTELEAMAPLQMEAYRGLVEEPEIELMTLMYSDASQGLADASEELDNLFPDLLLATPIDLDSAIESLQHDERDLSKPVVIRRIDMEALRQHEERRPSLEPGMLAMEALVEPAFDAESLAHRVADALADDASEDAQLLEGEALARELDGFVASLGVLATECEAELPQHTRDAAYVEGVVVRDFVSVVARGKVVAASMGDVDAAPVMFSELEELCNRAASMIFAAADHATGALSQEDMQESCASLARQARLVQQLALSHAALMAVDSFQVPTAESSMLEAHQRLDAAWAEEPTTVPAPASSSLFDSTPLLAMRRAAQDACFEWVWGAFVSHAEEALRMVRALVPRIQEAGSRVLVQQAGESMLGRAKQLLSSTLRPDASTEAVHALQSSVDAAIRACDSLTARSFRAPRTADTCPDAAAIQEALEWRPSKQTDKAAAIKAAQDQMAPLSVELRNFKSRPASFSMPRYRTLVVDLLHDTANLLPDAALSPMREQLALTGVAFVYAALDVLEGDSPEESLVDLKRLSLVLVQIAKWTTSALASLHPLIDADAARIMRQLKQLREVSCTAGPVVRDLLPVHGLIAGLADALVGATRALETRADSATLGDAVVHVVLLVGSLRRHYGHDVYVEQMCAMAEQMGHATCDVIEKQSPPSSSLSCVARLHDKTQVLKQKLARLDDLFSLLDALEMCDSQLQDPLPVPPRVGSAAELERLLRPETAALQQHDVMRNADAFGRGVVKTASVVRENASVVSDGSDAAKIVRTTSTLVESACKALLEAAAALAYDPSSEAHAQCRLRAVEECKSVALLAARLEEMVGEAASYASTTTSTKNRSSPSSRASVETSSSPPPSRGQTLIVAKSLTTCIAELSRLQTAQFASVDAIPSGLAGSLTMLPGTEERLDSLLPRGAGPELQRALIYFMNLLKHLSSGYLKGDPTRLRELVQHVKGWANKVILAMKEHEETGTCSTRDASEALRELHKHVVTKVVLSCGACHKAISGSYTTADGCSFHDSCFVCFTCGRPIQGSYFRDGDKIYCHDDLPMSNSLFCIRCREAVEYGSNYLEARDLVFHRECFTCFDCEKPLSAARFYIVNNEVRCQDHAK